MKPKEAVLVLDEMIKSLRQNPSQFNIKVEVNTAGAVGIGGSGGHGIVGIAQGGGTGFSATASTPSQMTLNIATDAADSQLRGEMDALVATLEEIKTELARPHASADKAHGLLKRVGNWVPNVIVAVVAHLIAGSIAGT
jgi:hypothetical protein